MVLVTMGEERVVIGRRLRLGLGLRLRLRLGLRLGLGSLLGCHGTREVLRDPEIGTRAQYAQCVAPWGQAALRLWCVPYAEGWCV